MDNVEQIKSRINIADLLREYIELKKAGANWKALCPFHSEKTPSFMVSEDKQIWHCFGCNEGGDIFGFIMRIEGVDFPEALRLLAKRAGVVLKRQDPALTSQKTKLLDILEAATSFYSAELKKSEPAQEYLKARQLQTETIEQFRLGFSPPQTSGWDNLFKHLESKGWRGKDIALAGLANQKDGGAGFYDRFRGRVMFPIFNHYGNIVGFTARVLPQFDDGKMGKYINTPETLVYKKSQILYGLNFAKQEIKKADSAIVVEGNMDVIALHEAGFKNVVATSGTALTDEQVRLSKRYTQNIFMSFDADSAGVEAVLRGIDVALGQGLNVKIIEMPKNEAGEPVAKDPDELVKKSPELWKQALDSPKPIIDFYIDANISKYNLDDPRANSEFCKLILEQIKKIKNSVERGLWIKKLGHISGVAENDLREVFSSIGTAKPAKKIPLPSSDKTKTVSFGVGAKFLALLLTDVDKYKSILEEISPAMISGENTKEFYSRLVVYYNDNTAFNLEGFKAWLEEGGKDSTVLDKLLMLKDRDYSSYEDKEILKELQSLCLYLKNNYFKKQRQALEQEMIEAEKGGNEDKIKEIIKKFQELT
ncbi:DNA primase [Patescibacteria group bacterium]